MLNDLFINSVILIAVLSIGTQIFRERPLTAKKTVPGKVLTGILSGLLGCILMRYTVHINSKVILDFRNIVIIFTAVFSGFISSVIAAAVIGSFRVIYFGISSASMAISFVTMALGMGCGIICNFKLSQKKKWIYCVIYALIAGSTGFIITIKGTASIDNALLYYWGSTTMMSIFIYFYINYLYQSGELYRRYRDEFKRDFLTGLNNVRQFDRIFNEAIRYAKASSGRSLSLLYIDIDLFKKVNDTYGHAEGDVVLKKFSKVLTSACKGIDLIFRNGGEEFSVILPDYSASNAVDIANRIRESIEANVFRLTSGKEINVTASIGVSSYPGTTKDIDKLLEDADSALYTAKRTGRNRIVLSEKKEYTLGLQ